MSCAEGDSSTCPTAVKISLGEELEEQNKVLKITMTPAITLSHPNPSQVTAEALLRKHLKITIKKKDQEEWSIIEIDSETIKHSATNSELSIRFKEEVKASEVQKIKVEVTDPWIYKTEIGTTPERVIYFKKKSQEMEIKEPEEQLNSLERPKQ